jgi:hypothetical protein
MPIAYTWTGRGSVESMASKAGGSRRHDESSKVVITNWFTDGEQLCVEYQHKPHSRAVRTAQDYRRLLLYCAHAGWPVDAIREYIKSSSIPAALLVYIPVRCCPMPGTRSWSGRDLLTGPRSPR